MKLPQVYADVNVSADSPHRGIPAVAFQSGFALAGKELAQGVEDIGRLYQKKQAQDEQAEAIYLQSQAELALQQSTSVRKQTETDGNTYLEDTRKDFQDVMERVAGQAKNPGTARLLRNHMAGRLITLDGQALNHAADLTKKAEVAQLSSTLDNLDQQIGATDHMDTAEVTRLYGMKDAAIDAIAATLGVDQATKLRISERQKTTEEIAYRHSQADPEGFATSIDRYRGMDAGKLNHMVTAAKAKIESDRKSHNVEMEKYYDRIDKEAEGERQGRLIGLRARANLPAGDPGRLTTAQLDNERAYRTFETPAEYEVLHKVVTEEPKERPSDPDTLTWVQLRTRTATPRITESVIDSLYLAKKLNRKDWEEEKGKLVGRQDHLAAEGRAVRGEARSIAETGRTAQGLARTLKTQDVAQAEQLLKSTMGLTAPQDKWDQQDGILYSIAFDQFTARAFQGNENPLAVARELGERFAPIRAQRIRLTIDEYKQSLPVILRSDAADKAIKLLDEMQKSGVHGSGIIDAYRRTILDWKRRENYAAPTPAPATPATPASGGAKPLRAPGTKPESGG